VSRRVIPWLDRDRIRYVEPFDVGNFVTAGWEIVPSSGPRIAVAWLRDERPILPEGYQ
jgi:hypothetical protein